MSNGNSFDVGTTGPVEKIKIWWLPVVRMPLPPGSMRSGRILSVAFMSLAGGVMAGAAFTVPHHASRVRVAATCQQGQPGRDVYCHA